MAPCRVDPNQKQAKSSIDHMEEDPFVFDRMARGVVHAYVDQKVTHNLTLRLFLYHFLHTMSS